MTVTDRLRFDNDLEESPRIKESRISVIQVYEMHVLRGLTVDEIVGKYDGLKRVDVEQAIRYSVTHPDFVRDQSTSKLTVDIAERQKSARESASA